MTIARLLDLSFADAELYGRVLTVNVANPRSIKLGFNRPVWAEADDFYSKLKEDGRGVDASAEKASEDAKGT